MTTGIGFVRRTVLALALVTAQAAAGGAEPAASPPPRPEPPVGTSSTINSARVIDFVSGVNGRAYRLRVSVPSRPMPAAGWPVVYLLDSDLHFGIAVETARLQAYWPQVRSAVIVGIGYQADDRDLALKLRMYDLTPPATAEYFSQGWIRRMGSNANEFGGVDEFLDTIEREVKQRVAALVKVDTAAETLMGHSLGGLTTLRALFTRPQMFDTYVAISPSIWFNRREILQHEPKLAQAVRDGKVAARVMISVGGWEQTPGKGPAILTRADVDEMILDTRMVDDARELGARLATLAPGKLQVETVVFADENHNSVPPAAISRGMRFALTEP